MRKAAFSSDDNELLSPVRKALRIAPVFSPLKSVESIVWIIVSIPPRSDRTASPQICEVLQQKIPVKNIRIALCSFVHPHFQTKSINAVQIAARMAASEN